MASPISSNLVEYTNPTAGDVVAPFATFSVKFLLPVDAATVTVAEDVRVTRQKGSAAPEAFNLFLPGLQWESDSVTMSVDPSVLLEPGDVVRISILGYDELAERAVTSTNGAVRLSRTVMSRLTIADPAAGLPGSPEVTEYPPHLLECDGQNIPDIDPDAPGGPSTWIEPHDPMVFRFSERMGTIALHGEVVGGRSVGSVGGMDFRSFRGLEGKAGGREHTAIARNMAFPLEVGAVYKLQILGHDASDWRLPATKDLSGAELSETFTRCFRTSHVRIEYPYARPYGDGDYRKDIFIQARYMNFKVTEKVKYVVASRGVRFTTLVRGENFTDPVHPSAYDVELDPDGSGLLCVEAHDENGWLLGRDCLRVYEEDRDNSWAVIGREGGEIKVGKFGIEFGAADTEVELSDGRQVILPPSLHQAAEVEIWRHPKFGPDKFSLLDIYDVHLPAGAELDTPASVDWEFNPNELAELDPEVIETLEPEERSILYLAKDVVLGTTDRAGNFLPYPRQLLLPWKKTALVYAFSETKAGSKEESKNCNEGFPEVPKCCEGQQYYQCNPCGLWCNCHLCGQFLSDLGVCECNQPPDSPTCCYGCGKARSQVDCSCTDDGMVCDQAKLDEAKRKKCVDCVFSDCYDASMAVKDKTSKGKKPKGLTTCVCTVSGVRDDQISCWQESPASFCCEYGAPLASTACDVATAAWKDPPNGCEDDWQVQKDAIDRHENEHIRRATENCEWAESALGAARGCAETEAKAKNELKLKVFLISNSHDMMNAWDEIDVDTSEEWDAPILDCDCPR